jgi:hypothetical protein
LLFDEYRSRDEEQHYEGGRMTNSWYQVAMMTK